MELQILPNLPPEWSKKLPVETYETRFVYVGFSRYDTEKQTVSQFHRDETGTITYTEHPCSERCLSRCYATEHVRVTVYSASPRVWKEEADETYFFVQQPTHAD